MRISTIIIGIHISCTSVLMALGSKAQEIKLNVTNVNVKKVFNLIEKQAKVTFVYDEQVIDAVPALTLHFDKEQLSDVITQLQNKTQLKFKMVGSYIGVAKNEAGISQLNAEQLAPNFKKINGTVKNATGQPLAGVTVNVKGTKKSVVTDESGAFTIDANTGDMLTFSYIGYITKELSVTGATVNIVLQEDSKLLGEIVVTALGIKKERKSLGYSVTQIQGESLTQARENNVMNSLVGKVSGLDISSTSGGVGAASSVMIRGVSSINQSSQPLYVINGVPMENNPVGLFNSSVNPSANIGGQYDNAPDMGDAVGNLNPDDIESISVLKGAAASALYGSRAKAGVILITTKSGKGNGIDFNSNYVAEQVMDRTNWQYTYGQGANGKKPATAAEAYQSGGSSWGGKLDGSNVVQFDGVSRPYGAQKNNVDNFYRTGGSWTNSLAINKAFDGGTIRLSGSDLHSVATMPNSGLNRQNFSIASNFSAIKNLNIDARFNYILEQAKNRPMVSDGAGNANYNAVFLPTSLDILTLKPGTKADGTELQFNGGNPYATNPWFAANEFIHNTKRERLISSVTAKYTFDNGLFLQGRLGRDAYSDRYTAVTPSGTAYNAQGGMTEQFTKFVDLNIDALVGKVFKLNDFSITPNLGASYRNTLTEQVTNIGSDFAIFGVYSLSNAKNKSIGISTPQAQIQSVYGTLEFAYKEILYLTGSIRNDWFSPLATPGKDNKLSIPYPSISASFVFTELLNPSSILNFGKLRAGYATVGQSTIPYQTQLNYNVRSETLNGLPIGNIVNTGIPNSSLLASLATEFEIGTELRFFKDRLSLDLTYYNKKSNKEIVNQTTSSTTGYDGAVLNSGNMQNKGFEALISGQILKSDNFSWTASLNGAYNDNKILSLSDGTTAQTLATSRSGVGFLQHIVGKPAFQVMAYDYKYDGNGNIVKDGNGVPVRGELKDFGSAINKYTFGWNNEFSYKGVNLSFLIDGKTGGKIFSATDYYGYIFGLHQATLENRETLDAAALADATKPTAAKYYNDFANNVSKQFVQDASFIKLRQVILGYNFPAKVFNNHIKGLNVSFVARNLFILMKKTDNIDPESSYNATFPGLELGGMPPVRTFGLNLSVKL